jgi:hypothetical protein
MNFVVPQDPNGTEDPVADEFIQRLGIVRPGESPIHDAQLLPRSFAQLAGALRPSYCWRAWEHSGRIRFLILRTEWPQPANKGSDGIIEAYFFDTSAQLISAAKWIRIAGGSYRFADRFEPEVASIRFRRQRPSKAATPRA